MLALLSFFRGPSGRAVAALSITQLIGWGTTYYLPALLTDQFARDLGLSRPLIFGGITAMLLVSAVLSPFAGRVIDRRGARPVMMASSAVMGLGLALLALSQGVSTYYLSWIVIGLGAPGGLSLGAASATVQVAPDRARASLGLVLLVSGLASTAFWPLIITLDSTIGWRAMLGVFAGAHAFLCVVLHGIGLIHAVPRRRSGPAAGQNPTAPGVARHPRSAFVLVALAFSSAGLLSWAVPLHMIGMFRFLGHDPSTAVAIGTLFGPSQLVSRFFDVVFGRRVPLLATSVAMMAIALAAVVLLAVAGASLPVAAAFVVGYGIAVGWTSILRAVVPLHLFGAETYALMSGRLALPQNAAFAVSPLLYAKVADVWGMPAVLGLSIAIALVALVFTAALAWREG